MRSDTARSVFLCHAFSMTYLHTYRVLPTTKQRDSATESFSQNRFTSFQNINLSENMRRYFQRDLFEYVAKSYDYENSHNDFMKIIRRSEGGLLSVAYDKAISRCK